MLSSLLAVAASAGPLVQSGAIIAATFILEDAATVMVAILSAAGTFSAAAALVALYVGIAAGDVGLYGLGHLASRHRWARRLVPVETYGQYQRWLRERLVTTVAATRFLPGLRLPVYTACGFLHMPLARFSVVVVAATLIWTTLLFAAAYEFGSWAAHAIGVWRWPAGFGLALVTIFVTRRLARRHVAAGVTWR